MKHARTVSTSLAVLLLLATTSAAAPGTNPAWDSLDSVGSSKRTAGRLYRKGRGTAVVVNLGKGRGWPMCVLGLPGR